MVNDVKTDKVLCAPIRPAGPPKVWTVIEGVGRTAGEGPIRFSIQEIPEDRHEDVVALMASTFIEDEPLCRCCNGKDDPVFVQDFSVIWRNLLKQGLSVGAFVEDPSGGKPIIAGVNLLGVDFKERETTAEDLNMASPDAKSVMSVVTDLSKEAHVYEKYGVDRYMFAFGLCVNPSYRGQALGGHILRARENIGREYKIPVTLTAFTSPISQKLAARTGFEVLLERDYDQIFNDKGEVAFPKIHVKTLKIMGKRLY